MYKKSFHILGSSLLTASLMLVGQLESHAGIAEGFELSSTGFGTAGQFSVGNGKIHGWAGSRGYRVFDIATGEVTEIGQPANGVNTNGAGDPFGVYDPNSDMFYAGTFVDGARSDVYKYDVAAGAWVTPGKDGVVMNNAYGADTYNGQLYVSGLAEPWNGSIGQDSYIFAFDHTADVGDTARHDTLIQTAGNSAYVTVGANGDVYYATYDFSNSKIYKWTAEQVASVTNDLYADEEDTFLTLDDGEMILSLPGGGNGIAVDDAGHVFFSANKYVFDPITYEAHTVNVLGMVDGSQPEGYRAISTHGPEDSGYSWYGALAIEGDFLKGDALYIAGLGDSGFGAITMVPEPASLALFGLAGLIMLRRRK